jgi:hypothetical protein
MYNAHGIKQEQNQHGGSTYLHMDLTDAINVMVWAAQKEGKPGYALWHIFPAAASSILRKFLLEELGFSGTGDPIHSQTIYLTPAALDDLAHKYDIRPYTILQRPGQVVFIPAGCAHQVCRLIMKRYVG